MLALLVVLALLVAEATTFEVLHLHAPGLMYLQDEGELFNRVALTAEQVSEYGLPTAPPKQTCSRTKNWWGMATCQLEALPPDELRRLVVGTVEIYLDTVVLYKVREQEVTARRNLSRQLPAPS